MKKKGYRFVFILIVLIMIVIPINIIKKRIEKNNSIEKGKETIRYYLKENFGSDNSKKMKINFISYDDGNRIVLWDDPTWLFEIDTPLLKDSFDIRVDENCKNIVGNTFPTKIIKEKNLTDEFTKKLVESMTALPNNVTLNGVVYDIDIHNFFEDSDSLDELLKRCNYIFDGFTITMEEYDKGQAIAMVKDLFVDYDKVLNRYYRYENMIQIYIRVRTNRFKNSPYEDYVHGKIKKINANQIEIEFNPYVFENGNKSIEKFTKIVSITY